MNTEALRQLELISEPRKSITHWTIQFWEHATLANHFVGSKMPNVSYSNGHNTRRASQEPSSNLKDPPQSRRARILVGCDNAETFLQDRQAMSKASDAYWQLEWAFAKHYLQYPQDEEYFSLLANCHQTCLVLETTSNVQHTFLEVLTSTLTWCATRVKETNHTSEHKSSSAHLLSPCTVPCLLNSTWPKAICSVPTARESLRMLSSSVDDVEEMMRASNSDAALKQLEDLRSVQRNWAQIALETNKSHASAHESQILSEQAQLARMRTESSSMNTSTSRNARELRPYSPNEANDLLQVHNAPFKSSEAVELAEAEELESM